ncbi:MAG: hypothetical protein ACXVP5_05980 [Tumebacillaceae bacterium]
MIHLYIAIVCFLLFVFGPFSPAVELGLLVVGLCAGWFAFLAMDRNDNKKLLRMAQEAEQKAPETCKQFEGTYLAHTDSAVPFQHYITLMIYVPGFVFNGYCKNRRLVDLAIRHKGSLRIYHHGPFIVDMDFL